MKRMGKCVSVNQRHLQVKLVNRPEELEQVLRLRYESFVEESGNRHVKSELGLEQDAFDSWCDHLIVQDGGRVVGTYRLMPGQRAALNGGFYSETFFDLTNFVPPKSRTLELGRSCVAPEYRNGRVIQLLWEGIADYVQRHNYQYLIGCASLREPDSARLSRIHSLLERHGYISRQYGVQPRSNLRMSLQRVETGEGVKELFRLLPPLVKGYLWLGAQLAGDPVYDPDFRSVDYLVVLSTENIVGKYRRHFLGR
jgi:putative hemolysin